MNNYSAESTSIIHPFLVTKPIKIKKLQKDKEKQQKRNAFMSFLQTPTRNMSQSIVFDFERKNASDSEETYEQFVQDRNQCFICHVKLNLAKKRKCGFCSIECCSNHLRKCRRKNTKFQRICDWCEDKTLFQNYMKFELKSDQALITQEQIIILKHQGFMQQISKLKERQNELDIKASGIRSIQQQQFDYLQKQQQTIAYKQSILQTQQLQLDKFSMILQHVSASKRDNFEQDFQILTIENDKLAKDLLHLDMRRQQIQKAIQKREKQILLAYQAWQKRQQQKIHTKHKSCVIY